MTAHDETVGAGPTVRSADLAVATARERSYSVETILALDNPTPATSDYFHQPRFDHWQRWELDERDLGRVRNAIVPQTKGRYIAFLDADDLYSENWLAEGIAALDAAAERGERAIAHPELNDGAVRASRHPERPVVPGLAIRDRDAVARVASPRRAGHDHLQKTA